jgi:hypothetical protein
MAMSLNSFWSDAGVSETVEIVMLLPSISDTST